MREFLLNLYKLKIVKKFFDILI